MAVERMSGTDDPPSTIPLYRIVRTNPAQIRDFLSERARGAPLKFETARALRLWDGLSVYRTREQAAVRATMTPRLGQYVAELAVPLDGSIELELDNGRNGHCTSWGDPWTIRTLVVSVTIL
jgi:hypothetical protein